jgi:hypothetical protein
VAENVHVMPLTRFAQAAASAFGPDHHPDHPGDTPFSNQFCFPRPLSERGTWLLIRRIGRVAQARPIDRPDAQSYLRPSWRCPVI